MYISAKNTSSARSMYVYVATHEWLQLKADFHKIVCMYHVVIRKLGKVLLISI